MKNIMDKLAERIGKEGPEVSVDCSDGTPTLRFAPNNLGPDNDGLVVTEVCRVPVDDVEDACYIQIYTTVAKDLEKDLSPTILRNLNEINLRTLLGSYHILSEYEMMYHKYILRLPLGSEEFLCDNIYAAVSDCIAIIDNDYLDLLNAIR